MQKLEPWDRFNLAYYNPGFDRIVLACKQWGGVFMQSELGNSWYLWDEIEDYVFLGDL